MAKKHGSGSAIDIKGMILAAASGRMLEVLEHVAGIPRDFLQAKEGPCPKCGGNTRFRVIDEAAGAVFCSHCFSKKNGDIFAAIQWARGVDFQNSLKLAGEYLGVRGATSVGDNTGLWKIIARPWNDMLVGAWCLAKQGINPGAVKRVGGMIADYGPHTVLAIPVMGEDLRHDKPVGYVIYNITGGTLPKKNKDGTYEEVKVKLTYDCKPGVIGNPDAIRSCSTLLKAEGSTDLLAWESSGFPEGVAGFTNSNGCGQWPLAWMIELGKARDVLIVHDADEPGQAGAMEKWGPQMASAANNCRNVSLPYKVEKNHGKDSRDWLNEGGDFSKLLTLPFHQFGRGAVPTVPESVSDPHRLARINLRRYDELTHGGTLRFWNDEHYTWKPVRGCWKLIKEGELKAKVGAAIKQEFNRSYLERVQNGEKVETVEHVTSSLVSNVISAMNSATVLPSSIPLQSWVEGGESWRHRNLLSVQNGLIDLDALLDPNVRSLPDDRILIPHDPRWFSLVRLPYKFDPQARSDRWEDALRLSFDGNNELFMVSQEWAGYSLIVSTNFQKFLCLEGLGRNGKSMYMAGLQAIVGVDNCSFLGLEDFSDTFAPADTIGKLLNISADCGEIEKVAEGIIKKLASGDRVSVNRKGLSRMTMLPTARLVVSFNARPRFSDKSGALWRRMILLPFRKTLKTDEIVYGMDKAEYWINSGELPGMLNWAIRGLLRLMQQGGFTNCVAVNTAIEHYQLETNPARAFLLEHVEQADQTVAILSSELYAHYARWCRASGYAPVNAAHFGAEVHRTFPLVQKARAGGSGDRQNVYKFLRYSVDEIAGVKIDKGGF